VPEKDIMVEVIEPSVGLTEAQLDKVISALELD
jgi:hypothetical protein